MWCGTPAGTWPVGAEDRERVAALAIDDQESRRRRSVYAWMLSRKFDYMSGAPPASRAVSLSGATVRPPRSSSRRVGGVDRYRAADAGSGADYDDCLPIQVHALLL
jgi:hypothetical protein